MYAFKESADTSFTIFSISASRCTMVCAAKLFAVNNKASMHNLLM